MAENEARIYRLEQENARLRALLRMPSTNQRQSMLDELLISPGHFNRADLTETFGISKQQASHDIQAWLKANPAAATYNVHTKRYERTQ